MTAEELGNILDAVSEDGIMPEVGHVKMTWRLTVIKDLSFDQLPESTEEEPHSAAQQILQQYDTGHLGKSTTSQYGHLTMISTMNIHKYQVYSIAKNSWCWPI